MKKYIIFYITGHGFGHAVRSAEVIDALLQKDPEVELFVRTDAPEWLFPQNHSRVHYESVEIDIGAIQKNSFEVDVYKTYHEVSRLFQSWKDIFNQERAILSGNKIQLVLGDIPPLAFRIADKMNIPAMAIGNFSWNWIYEDWLSQKNEFSSIVDEIKRDYATVHTLFRIPGHEPMSAFPNIVDVPHIGRKGHLKKETLQEEFNIPDTHRVLLLALPQYDQHLIPWDKLSKFSNWIILSPFSEHPDGNILPVKRTGFKFSDLISASDVVLSKPGYGIVTDCYTNRTPLLYISRKDFRECDVLIQWLDNHSVSQEMTVDELVDGEWQPILDALTTKKQSWDDVPVDGAQVIAGNVLEKIGEVL